MNKNLDQNWKKCKYKNNRCATKRGKNFYMYSGKTKKFPDTQYFSCNFNSNYK